MRRDQQAHPPLPDADEPPLAPQGELLTPVLWRSTELRVAVAPVQLIVVQDV